MEITGGGGRRFGGERNGGGGGQMGEEGEGRDGDFFYLILYKI